MNLQDRTKSYTLKQLIKILYLKEDYNDEAVAAAEAELERRDVSQEEVDVILKEVELEDERNSTPNTLQKAENAIGEAIPVSSKFLNPFVEKEVPELLKGVAVFLIFIPLAKLIYALKDINFLAFDLDFIVNNYVSLFGPLVMPVAGGIFLWKFKEPGWYLSIFTLISLVVTNAISLVWYVLNLSYFSLGIIFFELVVLVLNCLMVYVLYQKRVIDFLSIKNNVVWIISTISILWAAYAGVGMIQIMMEYYSPIDDGIELLSQ